MYIPRPICEYSEYCVALTYNVYMNFNTDTLYIMKSGIVMILYRVYDIMSCSINSVFHSADAKMALSFLRVLSDQQFSAGYCKNYWEMFSELIIVAGTEYCYICTVISDGFSFTYKYLFFFGNEIIDDCYSALLLIRNIYNFSINDL